MQRDLAARGHELEVQGDFCSLMGGGQAVMRKDGVNYGASDPRKDGAAVPEPVTKNEERKTNTETKRAGPSDSGPPVSIAACSIRFRLFVFPYAASIYHLN